MTSRSASSLCVRDFFQQNKKKLRLKPLLKTIGFPRAISLSPSQKDFSPILVWGRQELAAYDALREIKKTQALRNLWKGIACVVLVEDIVLDPEALALAREKKLALFQSDCPKELCLREIEKFVSSLSSEQIIVPGGLLSIFNLGVLIVGDSGIGKSESALELISRGYEFVSDDVTSVIKNGEGRLIGRSPDLSRNFMEVRGLGIINIKKIFGSQSVCAHSPIDLVIQLKRWEEGKDYDRLGLEFPEDYTLLDVKIPKITLPVGPGRNISTLIEVACKVNICRKNGYNASVDLVKRLDRALSAPKEQEQGP